MYNIKHSLPFPLRVGSSMAANGRISTSLMCIFTRVRSMPEVITVAESWKSNVHALIFQSLTLGTMGTFEVNTTQKFGMWKQKF